MQSLAKKTCFTKSMHHREENGTWSVAGVITGGGGVIDDLDV